MKRKILTGIGLTGVALVISFHITLGMKNSNSFDMKLENIESLAGCEVSSNSMHNIGRCHEKAGGGETCVKESYNYLKPVCSGDI